MTDEKRKPVRFQVILSAESVDRLDRLKDALDYTSRADVLRTALRILEVVVDEGDRGAQLWVKDGEGNEHRLVIG
jgi:Arc/MetJ-type ribon-helix-helix transcriptional regulator